MSVLNYFIINPAAGNKNRIEEVKNLVADYFEKNGGEYTIYVTKSPQDATVFVKNICKNKLDRLNFFACGGDGTFNEVASGAVGVSNAFVVPYPIGSGNDFIKSFDGLKKEDFLNIDAVLKGEDKSIDVIRVGEKYCFNITCVGVDATAAKYMPIIKRAPLVGGLLSYCLGLAVAFIVAMRTEACFYCDGERVDYGKKEFTLASLANGKWYGGGFKAAPVAELDDGLLDFVLVPAISRIKFFKLVGIYKRGEHLEKIPFIKYKRCRRLKISAPKAICLNLDGEILEIKDPEIEIVDKALNIIVPRI
ncbi:MAG: diacylglycerol kinase family lipid kinase [Ruminococcaceae bacterium]|nr:diacylglycerol kinase family lipid kinase [Oscillospiraceae bacterium]